MIFVDTNVFMYAVGRDHPLRDPARAFFADAAHARTPLVTSAEVLQELAHAYLARERRETLEAALALVSRSTTDVWPLESGDVMLALQLRERHPTLQARDLCHLASCRRRGVRAIKTFDRTLHAVAGAPA